MKADIEPNRKFSPIVIKLFMTGRKRSMSQVFIF